MLSAEQLYVSTTERTFQYDSKLPALPVPSLNNTLKKYLESVQPLVSAEEYAHTKTVVQEFENGVGKVLHEALLARAKNMPNWLEKWWLELAYLTQRAPLIPISNMGGIFPQADPLWAPNTMQQLPRAAMVTHYIIQYWKLLYKERLKPDKPRGNPWSMSQYRYVFNTSRIPGEVCDTIVSNFKTEYEGLPPSNYIIVLCKGRLFKMEVLDSAHEPIGVPELEQQFQFIQDLCHQSSPVSQKVASLTCDERTRWAKNRQHLIESHPTNKRNFEIIVNAIIFICLDERAPSTESEALSEGIGGDICNRWADTYNIVIFKNGVVATNGSHAACDGMVGVSMGFYVYLNFQECKGKWQGSTLIHHPRIPVELTFHVDTIISTAIDTVISYIGGVMDNILCQYFLFSNYGQKFISSKNVHPDAFIQMALQLAYYRLHKSPAPTYETASTRSFYNGRTETVRSCSVEAITWVQSMLDPASSMKTRLQLLKRAIDKHSILMREAQKNEGCDRHLLGLYVLSVEMGLPLPSIYQDPAWIKSGGSGNFILSTSFTGYTNILGAVTAMCTDGYGIFYCVSPLKIAFNITSWKNSKLTDIDALKENISISLHDMQTLFYKSSL